MKIARTSVLCRCPLKLRLACVPNQPPGDISLKIKRIHDVVKDDVDNASTFTELLKYKKFGKIRGSEASEFGKTWLLLRPRTPEKIKLRSFQKTPSIFYEKANS